MNNLQGNISSNNGNGFGLHTNFFKKNMQAQDNGRRKRGWQFEYNKSTKSN